MRAIPSITEEIGCGITSIYDTIIHNSVVINSKLYKGNADEITNLIIQSFETTSFI